ALDAVQGAMGAHLAGAVPACTAAGKRWGIDEEVLPALAGQLEQARGVAFLRAVKAEADKDKIKRTFEQVLRVGSAAWSSISRMLGGKR
ncbi:MAG: hypothetical protein K2W96_25055, partial [Gemmataceae bacterium]|nr:hypothetical protein [Gemmataceae bacterium]